MVVVNVNVSIESRFSQLSQDDSTSILARQVRDVSIGIDFLPLYFLTKTNIDIISKGREYEIMETVDYAANQPTLFLRYTF